MKFKLAIVACLLVLGSLTITQFVNAQPSQVSTTVSLGYLNVQLTYPSEVLPGQAVTVTLHVTAKDSFHLNKLTVQIYYGDGNSLHLLTSVTVLNNTWLNKDYQVSKDIKLNVPAETPRTSLVALVSENFRVPYYSYSSYYYPFSYMYFPSGNPMQPYFQYVYPPTNMAAADDALAPLSYVKATTPEYMTLQNEYQMLQEQLAQSHSDNQKLQQSLQETQAEKNSIIADLTQQLASTQSTVRTLEAISAILAVIAIVLGFLLFKTRAKREKSSKE